MIKHAFQNGFKTAILIVLTLGTAFVRADSVIEFRTPPSAADLGAIVAVPGASKPERFLDVGDAYFRRLVRVTIDPRGERDTLNQLRKLRGVRKIEPIPGAELFSLELPANAKPIGNDPLSIYQWGLLNQGQIIHRDIDDIHDQVLTGKPGNDIGWAEFNAKYGDSLKTQVKIAVVDSGVALDHPDLKSILLPGWNFTTTDMVGDNQPYDDLGHGTHVAGIIAAAAGNGVGGRGMGSSLRIIPVKVLTDNEQPIGTPGSPKMVLADRITQGILFAMKNGASVINLSLGWPRSMDTGYLRQAVTIAQNKGIIVVAAAGNNSHDGTIYPCAYPGVVCVGAYSVDGTYAPFSNFGGHIDVSAPGDWILSTIPTKMDPVSTFFRQKGYGFMNGTSQAAPFVSGALALLRSLYPNESPMDSVRRILETAEPEGQTLYGKVNLARAAAALPTEFLNPELKEIDNVTFDVSSGKFAFNLGIRAMSDVASATIEISDESGANFAVKKFALAKAKSGVITTYALSGRVPAKIPANGTLVVTITPPAPRAPKTFRKKFTWIRDFGSDPAVKNTPFDPSIPSDQIGMTNGLKVAPQLNSLGSIFASKTAPRYYNIRHDGKNTVISVMASDGTRIAKHPTEITLTDSEQIAELVQFDANYDGKDDLMITYLSKDATGEILNFCYYNSDEKPLFKKNCLGWRPDMDLIKVRGSNFTNQLLKTSAYAFLPVGYEGGQIALPAFIANGALPKADRNPDPFETEAQSGRNHFYAFSLNGDGTLALHALDSYAMTTDLGKKLNLAWNDGLAMATEMTQSESQYRTGEVSVLFGSGRGFSKALTYETFSRASNGSAIARSTSADLGGLQPSGMLTSSVYRIGEAGFESGAATALFGLYSTTLASTTILDGIGTAPPRTSQYQHPDKLDNLLSLSATYETPEADINFYLSKNKIVLSGQSRADGSSFSDTQPLYRYSFIAGRLFSELYFPITAQIGGREEPALYIDRSQINASEISVLAVTGKQFADNGLLHYSLPSNCRSLNPVKPSGKGSTFEITLLCVDTVGAQKNWSLKSLPLVVN
jgi:cell wall-associated protease